MPATPSRSHDLWFLTEDIRWGVLPEATDTKALVAQVNRAGDLARGGRAGGRAGRRDARRAPAAAARPSSTARSSIPRTRPPTSPRCPSRSSRGPEHDHARTASRRAIAAGRLHPGLRGDAEGLPPPAHHRPGAAAAAGAGGADRCLAVPRQRAERDAAAADQGLGRCAGPDRRPLLRPGRAGQGAVLASAGQPAAGGARLRAGGRRRHPAGAAGRHLRLRHARARPDLPGAADGAAAGLAAAGAGRLPGGAALGDLRDLHHLDLADHHQHRGRRAQRAAGLPQRRRGDPAARPGLLLEDRAAGGRALHLHRPQASASACPGWRSSRPRC